MWGRRPNHFLKSFLCNWCFVARNILNVISLVDTYPTRPGIWYKFHGDRETPCQPNTPDSMSLRDRLNVRPRSREFIEARVLRLLMDTCCHHAEACVHRVAASPSVRPGSQGRDLESSRSRPNWRPMKPPFLRFLLLACLIKARVPRVSSGLPVQPPGVQPPEAEWN